MKARTLVALLFVAAWTAGSFWAASRLYRGIRKDGVIEVRVSGHDGRINLDVPSFFAVQAFRHAEWATSEGRHTFGRHDAEQWAPALRAALTELEAYDDVPLLEIEDHGSLVTMHKHGGRFVLQVEDGRERVKVVMPVKTVRRVLDSVDA
jgi:hypothetical protein